MNEINSPGGRGSIRSRLLLASTGWSFVPLQHLTIIIINWKCRAYHNSDSMAIHFYPCGSPLVHSTTSWTKLALKQPNLSNKWPVSSSTATQIHTGPGDATPPGADTHHLIQLCRQGGQRVPMPAGPRHRWQVSLLQRGRPRTGRTWTMGGEIIVQLVCSYY